MPYRSQPPRGVVARTVTPVVPVLAVLALMWLSEAIDLLPGTNLDQDGIRPRDTGSLFGIVLAPFLHVGFAHLIANTGAFLVLGALIAWTTRIYVVATIGIVLIGGFGTWLIAQSYTVHVGASGVVDGYAAFLLTWAIVTRRLLSACVAVGVVIVYGSIAWGLLPGQPGVSWQGHLCGAIAGVLMAVWLGHEQPKRHFTFV